MDVTSFTGTATILVMTQDLSIAARRCAQLTAVGWRTLPVMDPVDALTRAKSEDVDLALLQLSPDDMVGTDFPLILRRVAMASYLPVTILADEPSEEMRCDFLQCGADDVLDARVSGPELEARLGVLLRFKELHDRLATSQEALQAALTRERRLLAQLRQDNADLQELVTTDPLTRTQNVRSFQSILEHEFKSARRYNHPLSLIMLDIDHFKLVNDNYGHPTGDLVLKELAAILKSSVRESDVVCRVGGEEFAIVLPRAEHSQAVEFAQRMREQVQRHTFCLHGHRLGVTVSLGISVYPRDPEVVEPAMLLHFADQALLHSKQNGRNRATSFRDLETATRVKLVQQYRQDQSTHLPGLGQADAM